MSTTCPDCHGGGVITEATPNTRHLHPMDPAVNVTERDCERCGGHGEIPVPVNATEHDQIALPYPLVIEIAAALGRHGHQRLRTEIIRHASATISAGRIERKAA